jgi:hypothetical protein
LVASRDGAADLTSVDAGTRRYPRVADDVGKGFGGQALALLCARAVGC